MLEWSFRWLDELFLNHNVQGPVSNIEPITCDSVADLHSFNKIAETHIYLVLMCENKKDMFDSLIANATPNQFFSYVGSQPRYSDSKRQAFPSARYKCSSLSVTFDVWYLEDTHTFIIVPFRCFLSDKENEKTGKIQHKRLPIMYSSEHDDV